MSEKSSTIPENDGYISIEMELSFYEDNIELLTNDSVKIKSAYRKYKVPSKDKEYEEKMKAFIEAKNDLLEYQVKMNYKQFINK